MKSQKVKTYLTTTHQLLGFSTLFATTPRNLNVMQNITFTSKELLSFQLLLERTQDLKIATKKPTVFAQSYSKLMMLYTLKLNIFSFLTLGLLWNYFLQYSLNSSTWNGTFHYRARVHASCYDTLRKNRASIAN